MIFWSVILFGASISISGLLGLGELPSTVAPHEETQLAQFWHAIVAFGFIAVIFAHIYIGSVGMEGAIDAMATGEVEAQWALAR